MPIANLKITDEQLNAEMSELLLEIDHLKKTFEVIGRGFKQGKPVPKGSLDSIKAFLEAVEDIDVDAAREFLETLPDVIEISLDEVKNAQDILCKALTILNTPRELEFNPFTDFNKLVNLKTMLNQFKEKIDELRNRRRELEAGLNPALLSPPLAEEPDNGFHGMPFLPDYSAPDSFLEMFEGISGNSSLIDGASGARSLAGGPALESLGEALEMASAAGREFDGVMRDLDETGARVAATFEGEVEGLDAFLDGLKQGEGEVGEFGASSPSSKGISSSSSAPASSSGAGSRAWRSTRSVTFSPRR